MTPQEREAMKKALDALIRKAISAPSKMSEDDIQAVDALVTALDEPPASMKDLLAQLQVEIDRLADIQQEFLAALKEARERIKNV